MSDWSSTYLDESKDLKKISGKGEIVALIKCNFGCILT